MLRQRRELEVELVPAELVGLVLWDPAAHEPLAGEWDEGAALAAIRAIAADAEEAFDEGWPHHPRDVDAGRARRWSGTYLGGAGVVDALRRLEERGLVELRRDYVPYLEGLEPDEPGPSLMLGETGILLVRQRLSPSAATTRRACASSSRRMRRRAHGELLWGSPGTMLAARELGFDDLWQESAERLLADRDPETGLWRAEPRGKTARYLGAAHGFAGCVLALGGLDGAAETARATRWSRTASRTGRRPTTASSSATARSACSGATAPRG